MYNTNLAEADLVGVLTQYLGLNQYKILDVFSPEMLCELSLLWEEELQLGGNIGWYEYTIGHEKRVALFSTLIAVAMGLESERVIKTAVAALFHDTAKSEWVADVAKMCFKKIDERDYFGEKLRLAHPTEGTLKLKAKVPSLKEEILRIIMYHHENVDGTGYPHRLKCYHIPLESRIIRVADSLEAMAANRPYALKKHTAETAKDEIIEFSGKYYCPIVVESFKKIPNNFIDKQFEGIDNVWKKVQMEEKQRIAFEQHFIKKIDLMSKISKKAEKRRKYKKDNTHY